MLDSAPQTIYLKDYQAPLFRIHTTDLHFDLAEDSTQVTAKLDIERVGEHSEPLCLHGQELVLESVLLDGRPLSYADYQLDAESLTLKDVPERFQLTCVTRLEPHNNTSLEGLYKSRTMFCTQCEAEGFRKITYYLDRPDVLSVFTTTLLADAEKYPVLLSNGNLVEQTTLADGRQKVRWHDPFPKPAYLFALVAGDLVSQDDHFTTASGRSVELRIFVEPKDLDKCDHAMDSLKRSMRWDEEKYGREYDLDIFMIVAVDDFNMGAMENKGLNIFNTSCVLANPKTTTDIGFQRVEAVVAHEYFHNWSGNRVTCRDWFQLSLKEGFTVFRDSQFSADMGSPVVNRVENVQMLRTAQFAEDGGPMAHPVQPASFMEISNFYTLTIYEKGAEIVRMLHTLLGEAAFRKGSDLYFDRHDGQAVTIEDFVQAMADASGRDFSQFLLWYKQAGTPVLTAQGHYDSEAATYTLTVRQHCPSTPEATAAEKAPLHIPLAMGLLGEAGALPLHWQGDPQKGERADNTHCVLELTEAEHTFVFERVGEPPVPSLLRNFSAPVKLIYDYSRDELLRLMNADEDGFCRWDACQQLGVAVMRDLMADSAAQVDARLITGLRAVLEDPALDPAMVSLMLALPSEAYMAELADIVDVDAIHRARSALEQTIAQALESSLLSAYQSSAQMLAALRGVNAQTIALRSLKNQALHYLMQLDHPDYQTLCQRQFAQDDNMTDVFSALRALVHSPFDSLREARQQALEQFYQNWQDEPLVVNQWLAVQASSPLAETPERVKALLEHPAFDLKNPNKVRSVIGTFAQNAIHFHNVNGEGYRFLADHILTLDSLNPQIAARLVGPLSKWRRYDNERQGLIKAQLQRLADKSNLSKEVYEIVSKSLKE